MGTRRKDTPASQVQGMVRESFQEEVASKLNPEGHLGMSQVKRRERQRRQRG